VKSLEELDEEMMEFLRQPIVSILATLRKDGSPHQTAVWHLYEEGEVRISLTDTRVKYKHLLRDPRLSLAIHGTELPYKELVIEGTGEIGPDPGAEFFLRAATHYYGEEEGAEYHHYTHEVAKENRLVLAIRPTKVMKWNFAVEDDHHKPWAGDYSPTFDETKG
jgi:PPOX class probable F420-dependent enzyme